MTGAGCARPEAAAQETPVRRSAVTDGSIARRPEYRDAVRRFAARDYAGAERAVSLLLRENDLPPADRDFLLRQQALCRSAAAAGKGAAPKPSLAAVPAPAAKPAPADCGPRALQAACAPLGLTPDLAALRRAAGTTKRGTTLAGLARAAQGLGLHARGVQMDRGALARLQSPAVAWADGDHFLAVLAVRGDRASVRDPNKPDKEDLPLAELLRRSGGVLLVLSRAPNAAS